MRRPSSQKMKIRAAESIKKLAQAETDNAAVPGARDKTRAETHFSHVKMR